MVNDNFNNLNRICTKLNFRPVHGIIFDLGMSSIQLADETRGFSFQQESPLDMRFSPNQELTAGTIVNNYTEKDLALLIWNYGEERKSRQIAKNIIKNRPVQTTLELASIVKHAVNGESRKRHPATKTFQALRIAVNREVENLSLTLDQAVNLLGFGGRLVVISFHSLEDRVVKEFMRRESKSCICPPESPICTCTHSPRLKLINRGAIQPASEEIQSNPRSRSAKLRVAERIGHFE
jgi:16S rRNA (cytosine1402-N4)-methyltransferase